MDQYPARHQVDMTQWKTCQFPTEHGACGQSYVTFRGLIRHMNDKHLSPIGASLTGHWVHHCYLFERSEKKLSADEASYVGLAYYEDGDVDEHHFRCLQCLGAPTISKKGCVKHFVTSRTIHALDLATVNKWLVAKDSFQLEKFAKGRADYAHLGAHMSLTHGWASAAGEQIVAADEPAEQMMGIADELVPEENQCLGDGVELDAPEPSLVTLEDGSHWKAMWVRVDVTGDPVRPTQLREVDALYVDSIVGADAPAPMDIAAPSVPQPFSAPVEPVAAERIERLVQQLEEREKKADSYECDRPKISVSELCTSWRRTSLKVLGDDGNPLGKKSCPIPDTCDLDLSAFEQYLGKVVKSDSAIKDNMTGVRRFCNLITVDGDTPSPIGLLVALFEHNLLASMLKTELMSVDFTWNNKIAKAIDHLCDWATEEAQRKKWRNVEHAVGQVKSEVWYYKNDTQHGQKKARRDRARKDARRIEALASPDALKAAVKEAMVELWNLHNRLTQAGGAPSEQDRAFANVLIVGIVFVNGFAGRSGEWKLVTSQHFAEQIAAGKGFLECDTHKTARYYGTLAKHLAPGTIKALQVYASLPNKYTDLLLDPIRQSTKDASVHKALNKFGELFLPDTERPGVTLLRKMFHTKLIQMHREGQCLNLLAKVDAHSVNVAIDVYTVLVPENDAKLGKLLYEQVMGAPMAWPSEAELLASRQKGTTRLNEAILDEADIPSDDEDLCTIHTDITEYQLVVAEPPCGPRSAKKARKEVVHADALHVGQVHEGQGTASSSSQVKYWKIGRCKN